MAAKKVTDPALLKKLAGSGGTKVTDPGLLEKLHGDNYLHPDDMGPQVSPDPGLALPGTVPPPGAPAINEVPPSRTFDLSSSGTLNPLPAIAAVGDNLAGNIPIAGPYLQQGRDKINASIYGGTPEQARADIQKTDAANPEASMVGAVAGKTLPYAAAATIGGPIAAALGLEGSLGLRMLMGGTSSEAINFGDRSAHGEPPLQALGNATRDTVAQLPFYALGSVGPKKAAINAAPTVEELKLQADPLYKSAEQSGVVFSMPSVKAFVDGATSTAMKKGLDETLTKQSVAAVKRLQTAGDRNMSMADAMTIRKVLGNAAQKSLDTTNADHAISVGLLHDFDTFLEGATKTGPGGLANMAVMQGNAGAAHDALVSANKLWSAASKGEMLDKALEKAIATSKTKDVPLEKAIRDRFGAIEQSIIDGDLPGFSPKEVKTIQDVAHGAGGQKLASALGRGKFSLAGINTAAITGGGAGHLLSGGNPEMVALGAGIGGGMGALSGPIGMAGRAAARNISRGNAEYASAVARGGRPLSGVVSAQPGTVLKTLPGNVGRSVVTLSLGEWAQQQALPAQ